MRPWLERLWYPQGDRNLSHALATPALAMASAVFRAASATRRRLAPGGHRVEGARVISVGNLNVGGAGKTPVAIFLAQLGQANGLRVGVLSRGYGRTASAPLAFDSGTLPSVEEAGDEPRLIAQRCPGVRLYVGADRIRSATAAHSEGCQWLILDDGFQARSLARDLDLVVIDDEVLLGTGHLLPWGPLRESPRGLERASMLWRRAAADGRPRPPLHPNEVRAVHRVRPMPELAGQPVVVVTGVARPSSVAATATQLGARVVAAHFFSDHHRFTAAELTRVERSAKDHAARLVTTEKDVQRLPPGFAAPMVLDVEVLEGRERLLRGLGLEGQGRA